MLELKRTPFHERTSKLCLPQNWRRWAGYIVAGSYDLIVEAFFYSRRHLAMFLTQGLATMDGVLDSETSIVLQVSKLSYEWEIPDLATDVAFSPGPD